MMITTIIILVLFTGLAGCQTQADSTWDQVVASGQLRVGLDASYPPFEYVDEATGEIIGFDVDFANEIGRRLGLEMVYTNIAYDGLYDALLIGRVDILISALAAAPQYEGRAAFSVPYFNAGEHLVVPVTSPIRVMEDLEGQTVAVEYGAGGDVEARQWERRLEAMNVIRYPDPGAAINAVLNGEADAALVDGITARLGVGLHENLQLGANVNDLLYVTAVHPDSTILQGKVDEIINQMIADGTISALIDKWFGPQR